MVEKRVRVRGAGGLVGVGGAVEAAGRIDQEAKSRKGEARWG